MVSPKSLFENVRPNLRLLAFSALSCKSVRNAEYLPERKAKAYHIYFREEVCITFCALLADGHFKILWFSVEGGKNSPTSG